MKTNIISFIAIMLISILAMGFTHKATEQNTILIQTVDSHISSTTLSESAKIISNRLKDFSSDKFNVTVLPEKNQIQIEGINEGSKPTIENLVTQKGRIEFYRTYKNSDLSRMLQGNNQLFSILDKMSVNDLNPWIGCTTLSKTKSVNEYLNSNGQPQHCRYVWSDSSDSTKVCLYALRLEHDNGSLLSGKDIDRVQSNQDNKTSKYWYVEFSFKKPVVKVWSDITKRNIGKSIAIVIDNHVICAPVIRQAIESGKCQITGNFTEKEVKLFAALGKYGELPASFRVIK